MAVVSDSFVAAAIRAARMGCERSVANGDAGKPVFDLSPLDPSLAEAVKAAWLPVRTGQSVPMLGEEVGYVEPGNCR